jgi:hypothetical protein
MPVDKTHKMHRSLYKLHSSADKCNSQNDDDVHGWVTYTSVEAPDVASRTSFALPVGSTPNNNGELLSLPLLIDLAFGAEGKTRDEWTFFGSEMFDHAEVVNWWPEVEILQSVLYNFNHLSLFNPNSGKLNMAPTFATPAPAQQKMAWAEKENGSETMTQVVPAQQTM